jgi:hypothetical protein
MPTRNAVDRLAAGNLRKPVKGHCAVTRPIFDCIEAHVLAGERIHGDDTTLPVMAKGKTDTAKTWVYVRDDCPFTGGGVLLLPRSRRRTSPASSQIL